MSLFPSLTSTSAEDLLLRRYQIRKNAGDNFGQFVQVHNDWIQFIWYDEAFNAQTICDVLSSDAVRLFNLTSNLRTFVLSAAADNNVSVNLLYPLSAFSLSGDHVTIFNSPYVP